MFQRSQSQSQHGPPLLHITRHYSQYDEGRLLFEIAEVEHQLALYDITSTNHSPTSASTKSLSCSSSCYSCNSDDEYGGPKRRVSRYSNLSYTDCNAKCSDPVSPFTIPDHTRALPRRNTDDRSFSSQSSVSSDSSCDDSDCFNGEVTHSRYGLSARHKMERPALRYCRSSSLSPDATLTPPRTYSRIRDLHKTMSVNHSPARASVTSPRDYIAIPRAPSRHPSKAPQLTGQEHIRSSSSVRDGRSSSQQPRSRTRQAQPIIEHAYMNRAPVPLHDDPGQYDREVSRVSSHGAGAHLEPIQESGRLLTATSHHSDRDDVDEAASVHDVEPAFSGSAASSKPISFQHDGRGGTRVRAKLDPADPGRRHEVYITKSSNGLLRHAETLSRKLQNGTDDKIAGWAIKTGMRYGMR